MNRYELLLCDADNTLFDFAASEKKALLLAFADAGIELTDEQVLLYSRINDAEWKALERGETTREKLHYERFRKFTEIVGTGSATSPVIADNYTAKLGKCAVLFEGALDFVKKVSAILPLCIVSNGFSSVQRDKLVPILPYLSGVYISEEMGFNKPDPRMITIPMAEKGLDDKRKVLMMGDSLTADIAAANNAGVDSLLFLFRQEKPAAHPATFFAGDFDTAYRIAKGND